MIKDFLQIVFFLFFNFLLPLFFLFKRTTSSVYLKKMIYQISSMYSKALSLRGNMFNVNYLVESQLIKLYNFWKTIYHVLLESSWNLVHYDADFFILFFILTVLSYFYMRCSTLLMTKLCRTITVIVSTYTSKNYFMQISIFQQIFYVYIVFLFVMCCFYCSFLKVLLNLVEILV